MGAGDGPGASGVRRELTLAPVLIAAVAAGDTRGASRVSGHLRMVLDGLHVHHSGEDELQWLLLAARAEPDAALASRMHGQHNALATTVREVSDARALAALSGCRPGRCSGRRAPRATDVAAGPPRRGGAARLAPGDHLGHQAEWARLGKHGFANMPTALLFRQLGAILEDADPAECARFLAAVPPPVRLLWAAVGRRRYDRYTSRLRRSIKTGTPSVTDAAVQQP